MTVESNKNQNMVKNPDDQDAFSHYFPAQKQIPSLKHPMKDKIQNWVSRNKNNLPNLVYLTSESQKQPNRRK